LDLPLECEQSVSQSLTAVELVGTGRVEGFVAAHAVTTPCYVTRKSAGRNEATRRMDGLLLKPSVAPVSGRTVRRALALGFSDYEDGVAYVAAEEIAADFIVSRGSAGLRARPILALAPEQLARAVP
jgi:hypothetical protein